MDLDNSTFAPVPANTTSPFRYGPLEFVDSLPGLAVLLILVVAVASVVGTAGNVLILVSIATDKALQNVESVFVVNLAMSDLYVTMVADPLSIVGKTAGWEFFAGVPGLCRAVGSLCTISCVASLMTLSAMSCNRYVLIVHPNHYRHIFTFRHCLVMCCCFYLVGLLLVSLNFFGVGDHSFDHKSLECIWDRMANHNYTIVFATVMVWVPIVVTGMAYSRLYLHVRKVRLKVHSHANDSANTASASGMAGRGIKAEDSLVIHMSARNNAREASEASQDVQNDLSEDEAEEAKRFTPRDDRQQQVSGISTPRKSDGKPSLLHPPRRQFGTPDGVSDDASSTPTTLAVKIQVQGKDVSPSHSRGQPSTGSSNARKRNYRLARTLFLIYLVFAVCWLPFSLLIALDKHDTFSHELHVVIVVWAHLHPSVNWLVYYYTHNKFRKAFRRLLHLDACARPRGRG